MMMRMLWFLVPALIACASGAQTYPAKPIQLVVPFPAGGGTDILARTVAQRLAPRLGQAVVIDNRPGASGIIGAQLVAKAVPDGYTLVVGVTNTHAINTTFFKKLPYDAQKDFLPVGMVALGPHLLLVNSASPARTLAELVQLVKTQPGIHSFASYGLGSTAHLAGEMLKDRAGIDMTHVPYKGIPPALADLAGGQVTTLFSTTAAAIPLIRSGKLRALAVTSDRRMEGLPDVPTMEEAGMRDAVLSHWYGLFAPAGTPQAVVDRLSAELRGILFTPELRDTFAAHGVVPMPMTPGEFAAFQREEIQRWGRIVRASGATAD